MANVGHSSTPRPIYSAVQNYRQLHPRGSIRASPIEGSGAHCGEIDQTAGVKVRCSAAIMVRCIRVNFGHLRHQIMVG